MIVPILKTACRGVVGILAPGAFLVTTAVAAPGAAAPDFLRDVRPILSSYCFKCHGPDEGTRKGGLRLDIREAAVLAGKSGELAIVPGQPDKSEVLRRILSNDDDELMPPPAVKHPLTPAQKELLRRWIAAGAEYRPHWAFVAPRAVPVPSVQFPGITGGNPIDAFVADRLKKEGSKPSPEADRLTLARRVSLDLIGLPPTPEEADAFAADRRPGAYERLVDRLLASPRYGERWARKWLDLARYADSNGYEKDRDRSIWPYRDWVIRALNADMTFDQFTLEQVAGDLLPGATRDQRVATGFHRNTMLNEEGGIDPLEFRFHAMVDRVNTTGTAWLGLTVGCAQCHTHKYDPILQKEYYQLMAFLNNADEPDLDLPADDAPARERERAAKVARLLTELPSRWPIEPVKGAGAGDDRRPDDVRRKEAVERAFAAWLQNERNHAVAWRTLPASELKSNLPLLTPQPDDSILASGDITKSDAYELAFTNLPPGITAIRLEALPHDSLPAHGPGLAYYEGPKGDFFLGEFQVKADGRAVRFGKATETHAKNNFGSGASAKAAIDGDPQTGWSCADRPGEANNAVFALAEPLQATRLDVKLIFGRHYACSLGRFRISVTTDPKGAEARKLLEELAALLARPEESLSESDRARLREEFLLTSKELAEPAREIRALRRRASNPVTLVLRERPATAPRPTFIHHRGEFLQPGTRVEADAPQFLPGLPPGAPRDRLALARWLVSRENPLTARVVVNRHWAAFFGNGIVGTQNDFGFQGDLPTHPELLDWLAIRFMDDGWSFKKLHRLIVTSATYRQASGVTPRLLARDPQNRLLARGPRFRLEAEIIRDAALLAAGVLSPKMYGPPVKPPQPSGVTEVSFGSPKWDVSAGEDRYRRSLYTFQKRSAPFAMFNTFDAPSGEICVARREVSNTPLQSLTLLNDVAFVEAAQKLGALTQRQSGDDDARITFVFRRVLTRPPSAPERARLLSFVKTQRSRLQTGELNAAELAGGDAGKESSGTAAAVERAAWTLVARAVLNVDEAIVKP